MGGRNHVATLQVVPGGLWWTLAVSLQVRRGFPTGHKRKEGHDVGKLSWATYSKQYRFLKTSNLTKVAAPSKFFYFNIGVLAALFLQ